MIFQIGSGTVATKKSDAQMTVSTVKELVKEYVMGKYENVKKIETNPIKDGGVGFNFYDNAGHKIGNGITMPADSISTNINKLPEYVQKKVDGYASLNNNLKIRTAIKE